MYKNIEFILSQDASRKLEIFIDDAEFYNARIVDGNGNELVSNKSFDLMTVLNNLDFFAGDKFGEF